MSYSQLIIFYLILGLVNYSYEFNGGNNIIRRRVRDTAFKDDARDILSDVFNDQDKLGDKLKESTRADEDLIKQISQNIYEAAQRMANAGVKDIKNADEWTNIQGELRRGINLVIDAYRKFIGLHRTLCEDVDKFAQDMISRYENELSALNRLNVPTSTAYGSADIDNPDWMKFSSKLGNILKYLNVHQQTLSPAYDCPRDLTGRALEYRRQIFNPPIASYSSSMTVTVPQAVVYTQSAPETFNLNCNPVNQDNGNRICPYAVADASQGYLSKACECSVQNFK